jgi:hypothetical protein
MRGLPTVPVPSGSDSEALDLPPRYFMELRLPAFSGLGDEQKNQAIPYLTELVVYCTILHTQEGAIRPDRLLGFWRR